MEDQKRLEMTQLKKNKQICQNLDGTKWITDGRNRCLVSYFIVRLHHYVIVIVSIQHRYLRKNRRKNV